MPDRAEHRTRAEHNEFLVQNLDNPFFDWKVTGLFYSALHYVDAYLAVRNIHPPTHAVRLGHTRTDPKLQPVSRDYRELLNESRTARYEPRTIFNQRDVNSAQLKFDTIKRAILPLI